MKKGPKSYLFIVLFLGAVLILIGCLFSTRGNPFNTEDPGENHENSSRNPAKISPADEETNFPHPYGRVPEGPLSWEDDPDFLKTCKRHQAILRMSAFQIAFPDPWPGERANVVLAAELLTGIVVQPAQYFSLNQAIGPYSSERGFKEGPAYSGSNIISTVGGGVCKVATTLFNAVVLANLQVLERHPHTMPVPYVPPGQDTTIAYGYKDFSFINNNAYPVVIWAGTKGDTLTVAIYGEELPPPVTWNHEYLGRQKRSTIYRDNPNLAPGEEKIIIYGADGVTVKSWLTIENPDGAPVTLNLGIDYYSPLAQVIERGPTFN